MPKRIKIPCPVCKKPIDPRGLKNHQRLHNTTAPVVKQADPMVSELEQIKTIVETFKRLSAASRRYVSELIAELEAE